MNNTSHDGRSAGPGQHPGVGTDDVAAAVDEQVESWRRLLQSTTPKHATADEPVRRPAAGWWTARNLQ